MFKWSIIASICGLAFNVVFDPIVGYFYKQYILGQPQKEASVLAKLSAVTTFVNALASILLVGFIYNTIIPTFKKLGFLQTKEKMNNN